MISAMAAISLAVLSLDWQSFLVASTTGFFLRSDFAILLY